LPGRRITYPSKEIIFMDFSMLRALKKLSQSKISRRTGISQSRLSRLERGKSVTLTAAERRAIARVLDVDHVNFPADREEG